MINGKVRGKQRRHSLRIVVCRLLPDLTDCARHGLSIRRDGTGSGVADEIGGSSALNGHDPQACGVLADADDYSFEDRGGCMRAKGRWTDHGPDKVHRLPTETHQRWERNYPALYSSRVKVSPGGWADAGQYAVPPPQ